MRNKQRRYTLFELLFGWGSFAALVLIIAGAIGWVLNVTKLVMLIGEPMAEIQTELIIRVVCAFTVFPGAVAGWF